MGLLYTVSWSPWRSAKISDFPKAARRVSRRKLLTHSHARTGMMLRPHPCSRCARLARHWSTGLREPELLQSETDAERSFRKFRLVSEDVQGRNLLTNFHGMDLTTDKLRSMVKKWQTLIEANVDVKTVDGYLLRVFCIGFTNKDQASQKKTCYAQHTQVKAIRKKMVDIITREVGTVDLKEVVNKLIPDSISKDIEKSAQGIYPLHDVNIRKVKVLKKPKFDIGKLLELHGDVGKASSGEAGDGSAGASRPEGYEPPIQESV